MLDAMAAGLTTKLMGLEDVVTLMDARAEKPNRPVTYKKAGSNFQTETHYLDIAALAHQPGPFNRLSCQFFLHFSETADLLSGSAHMSFGFLEYVIVARDVSPEPTHVAIREIPVRREPDARAVAIATLAAGSGIRILGLSGRWALITRNGQRLGYVSVDALMKLQ